MLSCCIRGGIGVTAALCGFVFCGAAHAQLTTFVIEFGNTGANVGRNDTISSFDVFGASSLLTQEWNPATAGPNADASAGSGNGLAADVVNNRIFWRAGNNSVGTTNGEGSLFVWDRANSTQRIITGASGATLPGGNTACAAFYNGAYWCIQQSTDTLTRLELNFSNPLAPTFTRRDFTNFDGLPGITSFSFGDIVISSDGILYGSANERLFRADVSAVTQSGGNVTDFQTLSSSSGIGMQMVLSPDEQTLYGARNDTANNKVDLYQVSGADGTETYLKTFNGVRFTDLTGVYATGSLVAAPEPTSLALLALPFAGLAVRKRRK